MVWSTTPTGPPTPPPDLEDLRIADPSTFKELIIIGSGPSALAVAARLREPTPSALFTDTEHQRYHWIRSHGSKRNGGLSNKNQQNRRSKGGYQEDGSLLVLDATGDKWLGLWDGLFKAFEIEFLRSPMFFHPGPANQDDLLGYAHEKGRENEVREIRGVVGKEISKHQIKKRREKKNRKSAVTAAPREIDERDRKDYANPSAALFRSYIESLIT
ncbi:hypothetical protein RUND412_005399 [Rhizina undulata]